MAVSEWIRRPEIALCYAFLQMPSAFRIQALLCLSTRPFGRMQPEVDVMDAFLAVGVRVDRDENTFSSA